ncbi:cation transporter [Clostridium sp. MSJ-4]|uniref:Cation transporter n=1 Tax=Clostridium simiarum TaxID=2841506 RepID=A0ABS6EVZ4_9CLOT|nr:cation transporter [Clostridium simiarum]
MKKILVEGMNCNHCVNHVTEALLEIEGVKSAKVDLDSKTALIEGDPSEEQIKLAIEEVGYKVMSVETV